MFARALKRHVEGDNLDTAVQGQKQRIGDRGHPVRGSAAGRLA